MRQAIDSPRGRQLYSQRIGTVEPVFANLRHNKRLNRLNYRGQTKVKTQWSLYCMVHNIEKLSKAGFGNARVQYGGQQAAQSISGSAQTPFTAQLTDESSRLISQVFMCTERWA